MQFRLNLQGERAFRREDFVVSPSNDTAVRRLEAWPAWPGGVLALVGPPGVGKSHLAALWLERAAGFRVERDSDVARIGERPALLDMEATRLDDEALFHLINRAARPERGLLILSRSPPSARPTTLPDLTSRLNALPTVEIAEPDDALLGELLLRLFDRLGIRAPDDLIQYLLPRMERSAAAAEALVVKIDETASASNRPIGRALAREILALDEQPDLL